MHSKCTEKKGVFRLATQSQSHLFIEVCPIAFNGIYFPARGCRRSVMVSNEGLCFLEVIEGLVFVFFCFAIFANANHKPLSSHCPFLHRVGTPAHLNAELARSF